jgi:class 3 adenylate cyclase
MTKPVSALIVSDDLIRAVQCCGAEPAQLLECLHPDQSRTVRGRREPVSVWRLPAAA